jgi:hypothetical protein
VCGDDSNNFLLPAPPMRTYVPDEPTAYSVMVCGCR